MLMRQDQQNSSTSMTECQPLCRPSVTSYCLSGRLTVKIKTYYQLAHLIKRQKFLYPSMGILPGSRACAHFTPLYPSVLRFKGIYSYLKLHRMERSRSKDERQLGIELRTSRTEGRVLTNCAILTPARACTCDISKTAAQ